MQSCWYKYKNMWHRSKGQYFNVALKFFWKRRIKFTVSLLKDKLFFSCVQFLFFYSLLSVLVYLLFLECIFPKSKRGLQVLATDFFPLNTFDTECLVRLYLYVIFKVTKLMEIWHYGLSCLSVSYSMVTKQTKKLYLKQGSKGVSTNYHVKFSSFP